MSQLTKTMGYVQYIYIYIYIFIIYIYIYTCICSMVLLSRESPILDVSKGTTKLLMVLIEFKQSEKHGLTPLKVMFVHCKVQL